MVLEPIVNDGTRNLVARINPQEMTLFEVIGPRDVVVFLPERPYPAEAVSAAGETSEERPAGLFQRVTRRLRG